MTAQSLMSLLSSILLPPSSHCTFIPTTKNSTHFKKSYYFVFFFTFLELCMSWNWVTLNCEGVSAKFLLNSWNYQPNNTSSHPKRPEYLTTRLREPLTSKFDVSLIYTLSKWTSFWLACNHHDICPTRNALICCYTALWTAMAAAKSCHSKG